MPKMDRLELCHEIRKIDDNVKRIRWKLENIPPRNRSGWTMFYSETDRTRRLR
jgi:hypothetical protein